MSDNFKQDKTLADVFPAAGVTLLAAVLRFPLLGRLPPGLYRDEAINGLDALGVLEGVWPIFFTANNGREPLFIYLVAISVGLFGRTALAVRLASAVLGTLTVPATYLLGRALFGRRVALLAALITAISVWPINLSRVGFRAVAMPLFVALTLWAFWRVLKGGSMWGGVFAGLLVYTYLAARFVPLALGLFVAYLVVTRQPVPWRRLLLFALVALVVAAPLLGYFALHRSEALQRAYQVSILNPAINGGDLPGTLVRHVWRTLLMFNLRGDFIPRHNVPLRPVFDPLLSVAFLLGVVHALRRWRNPAHALVLLWIVTLLLPTVLAEDAPHFLRGVGVLPVLFFLPALGLAVAGDWLARRWSPRWASLAVAGVLVLSLGWTVRDYFLRHAPGENAYYQFETGATELAAEINAFLATGQGQVYLDRRLWDGWAGVRFLVPFSPRLTLLDDMPPVGPEAQDVLLLVWPYADLGQYFQLLPPGSVIRVTEGAMERGDLEPEARLLYLRYEAHPAPTSSGPVAIFGDGILLHEASVTTLDDGRLQVRLLWQARTPPGSDYTATVQLLGPEGLIAQEDHPPTRGWYPMRRWRPTDRVFDDYFLAPPVPFDPATQWIIVALYDPQTLERLPVWTPDGAPLGDHFVVKSDDDLDLGFDLDGDVEG